MSARESVRRAVFAAFLALTSAIGALTCHGWPSALMVGASGSTFPVFYPRGRALRMTMLLVSEQMAANVRTAAAALYGARRAEQAVAHRGIATGGCRPSPAAASS